MRDEWGWPTRELRYVMEFNYDRAKKEWFYQLKDREREDAGWVVEGGLELLYGEEERGRRRWECGSEMRR